MAETFVDRALVAMARIKNDASPLDSKVDAATAIKYADAFIKVYRQDLLSDEDGNPIDISTIPNADKAKAYINKIRDFHKEVLSASRVPQAGLAGKASEQSSVDSEFPIDLGEKE